MHRNDVTGEHADPASRRAKKAFEALSLSAVGLEFGVAVIIGLLFGRWLDSELGTAPWLLIAGAAIGFTAGVKALLRVAKRAERADREPPPEEPAP